MMSIDMTGIHPHLVDVDMEPASQGHVHLVFENTRIEITHEQYEVIAAEVGNFF